MSDINIPSDKKQPKKLQDKPSKKLGGLLPEEESLLPAIKKAKKIPRKFLEQRNVLLLEEEEDETGEGGGSSGGRSGWDIPLPEEEYYEVHEAIRQQHEGKVDPGRKLHQKQILGEMNTADFSDVHPLANMAYFSGIDNQDETPLPGESTDEEVRNELELQKKLRLQKQLGLTAQPSPRPRPF